MALATGITAGIGAAGNLYKAIDGGIKAAKAKKEAEAAKQKLEKNKEQFAKMDTSNPYLNMENTMEDLTVNQQEADFLKQQQQQNLSNTLQATRQAAGGSGIAALAQVMANQGSEQAQKAAASIGAQEAANQEAAAKEASSIQGLEREGEVMSRQAEMQKIQGLMGMNAAELAAANAQQQAYRTQAIEGVTGFAQTGADLMTGKFGGVGKKILGQTITAPAPTRMRADQYEGVGSPQGGTNGISLTNELHPLNSINKMKLWQRKKQQH